MWFQQCAQIASKANNASNNWLQAIKKIKKNVWNLLCWISKKRRRMFFWGVMLEIISWEKLRFILGKICNFPLFSVGLHRFENFYKKRKKSSHSLQGIELGSPGWQVAMLASTPQYLAEVNEQDINYWL